MELDLGLHLGQNGAQSRPAVVLFFSFLFLLLGCGFDNDLIMVGLWVVACGGCGLWTWWWCELWVLIVVVVVEWVATLYGFQNFFFSWWVLFDFGLLMVVDLHSHR